MSDTNEERPRKFRRLSDIHKQEYERIRGLANLSNNGDSESNSHEDDSDEFSLRKHSRKSKAKSVAPKSYGANRNTSLLKRSGKRGRKNSSFLRCEASISGTKKVQEQILVSSSNGPPAMTLSKFILSSSNEEIISLLGLISLANGPPASGPGLPDQSEPAEPDTFECLTNRNPAEFSAEAATSYMRSC